MGLRTVQTRFVCLSLGRPHTDTSYCPLLLLNGLLELTDLRIKGRKHVVDTTTLIYVFFDQVLIKHQSKSSHIKDCVFTLIEVTSKLMVGAALHHFSHMLSLLVDGHGSYHAAVRGSRGKLHLNWAGLSDLTVQLLQQRRILQPKPTTEMFKICKTVTVIT